jgi:hypothetical protein
MSLLLRNSQHSHDRCDNRTTCAQLLESRIAAVDHSHCTAGTMGGFLPIARPVESGH